MYVGKHKTSQVAMEEVLEAGIALGLPFSKDNLFFEDEQEELDPGCGEGAEREQSGSRESWILIVEMVQT